MRRKRHTIDPIVTMPASLVRFDPDAWPGESVADAQALWDSAVLAWAEREHVDSFFMIDRLGLDDDGSLCYR